jgi:hypothetical protein
MIGKWKLRIGKKQNKKILKFTRNKCIIPMCKDNFKRSRQIVNYGGINIFMINLLENLR